jgi:hypothetical protein
MTSTPNHAIGNLVIRNDLHALLELQKQLPWVPGMIDLATSLKYSAHAVTTYVLRSFRPDASDLDALISLAFDARNVPGMRQILQVGGTIRTQNHRLFLRKCFLRTWPDMARVLLDGFRRNGLYMTPDAFLHDFEIMSMLPDTCTLTRRIMDETYGTLSEIRNGRGNTPMM